MNYDFKTIEEKWRKIWEEKNLYKAENGGDISSETNDGISVTYAAKVQQTERQRLYDAAAAHLAWTGLLYRGCCF